MIFEKWGKRGKGGKRGMGEWGRGCGVVVLLNMHIERKPFLYGKCYLRGAGMHNVEEHIGDQTLIWVHVVHMSSFLFSKLLIFLFFMNMCGSHTFHTYMYTCITNFTLYIHVFPTEHMTHSLHSLAHSRYPVGTN